VILPEHLPLAAPAVATRPPDAPSPPDERQRIIDALSAAGGNQTEAARALGISRNTLAARLVAHDIPRPRKRR
jgi:DNA-binding NtrC family response regulator